MSRAFEVEVEVARPVDEVWSVLTDWDGAPRWMPGIESMRADGPTAAGTLLHFHTRGKDRTSEIAEVEDGAFVVLSSTQGGVTASYRYELAGIEGGSTRVHLVADCEASGFPWVALGPVIRLAMRRADGSQLDTLKTLVESAPA